MLDRKGIRALLFVRLRENALPEAQSVMPRLRPCSALGAVAIVLVYVGVATAQEDLHISVNVPVH
jgi:hypothetical protein